MWNNYPYIDLHEMNLDWIIKTVKEYVEKVDNISIDVLDQAKAYTDDAIENYVSIIQDMQNELIHFENDVNTILDSYDDTIEDFKTDVNLQIANIRASLTAIYDQAVAYADQAVAANNEYLLSEMSRELANIKILDYFSGSYVTIQNMFDILARLHLEDPITYTQLAAKQITYNDIISTAITYYDLATNGNSLL